MAHHYNHPDERASGETVKDCIYCILVNLCSLLQVITVHVHLPSHHFTFCIIYPPSAIPVCSADLKNFISQLPSPFFLVGGFNAKNILWSAVLIDKRRRSVYDVCAGFSLIFLNTDALHT
jgi:hypothetical protein